MGGRDDRHWDQVRREQRAHQQRRGEDRAGVVDSPLLHPNNEGRDEERRADREASWAKQQEKTLTPPVAAPPAGGIEEPVEVSPAGPREAADHTHHVRGGEPRKHPRERTSTTPEPGRGPNREHASTREPADVGIGPDGQPRYEHGFSRRFKSGEGT